MHRLIGAVNRSAFWSSRIRVRGFTVQAPTADRWLYARLHSLGLMGAEDRRHLAHYIRPGMTVVDIGANIGFYSLMMADLVGLSGRVYAFEPDPQLFEAAVRNASLNNKENVISIQNLALGSRCGQATLYRSAFNSGDNRLSASDRASAVPVRVATLDEVLPGIRIDWIKIDVQGWEPEVFRGMFQTIQNNPQVRLYFEYWPAGLRKAAEDVMEPFHLLNQLGLSVFRPGSGAPLSPESLENVCAGKRDINLLAYKL